MTFARKTILPLLAILVAAPAFADGDVKKGEKVFRKCKSCHAVGEGAKNKVGPMLNGIAGATIGAVDSYKYSDVMAAKGAEGATWTDEELDAYLEKPKKHMPGTKMSFAGLRKEADRANVIAYLKTFP